jgi:hypothetical protein
MANKEIQVPVVFSGTVTVMVPSSMNEKDAKILAEKFALAKVFASINNPDSPDEDACEEFAEEAGISEETAGTLWDESSVWGTSGQWTVNKQS